MKAKVRLMDPRSGKSMNIVINGYDRAARWYAQATERQRRKAEAFFGKRKAYHVACDVLSLVDKEMEVFDSPGSGDRYTIVDKSVSEKDRYGRVYHQMYSASENPYSPTGTGMYRGDYYPGQKYSLGKRVTNLVALPEEVLGFMEHIKKEDKRWT